MNDTLLLAFVQAASSAIHEVSMDVAWYTGEGGPSPEAASALEKLHNIRTEIEGVFERGQAR